MSHRPKRHFPRIERLPPYVFTVLQEMKARARAQGEDIVDLGMGNPDFATPSHIVEKLQEAVENSRNHRYSSSRGIPKLRLAICDWYKRHYDVALDPETQAVVTIGAKEGMAHLVLAILSVGDRVVVPSPIYPIHHYAVVIAGGELVKIPMLQGDEFFDQLEKIWRERKPTPKALILCFPNNPTTAVVDYAFFERIVSFARAHDTIVIHDLAYADLVYDGYKAPSILQVPGAMEVAVELYSLSKGYNMPGWRVGFACGNPELIDALTRMKSYLDYGIFQPIQIASIIALNGGDTCVKENVAAYCLRRNVLCDALEEAGWPVARPQATMFVWAKIPEAFQKQGSLAFAKRLLQEAKVVVSPGVGFGEFGDDYIRFALVENEDRIRQAVRGIKKLLQKG